MVRRSYDKTEGSKEIGLLSRAQPDEIGVLGNSRGVARSEREVRGVHEFTLNDRCGVVKANGKFKFGALRQN